MYLGFDDPREVSLYRRRKVTPSIMLPNPTDDSLVCSELHVCEFTPFNESKNRCQSLPYASAHQTKIIQDHVVQSSSFELLYLLSFPSLPPSLAGELQESY